MNNDLIFCFLIGISAFIFVGFVTLLMIGELHDWKNMTKWFFGFRIERCHGCKKWFPRDEMYGYYGYVLGGDYFECKVCDK